VVFGRALRLLAIGTLALGCSSESSSPEPDPPADSLLSEPLGELPAQLSEVGVYKNLPELRPSRVALEYEPGYPLWSDGGLKQRLLVLPAGQAIDAADPEAYVFPLGTLIFKTFSFRTPASPDVEVPVETRLLRATDEGWELSAYAWNESATDAELLELRRTEKRTVLGDDGSEVEHSIPTRMECQLCHESSASAVLGINELQLAKSGDLELLLAQLEPAPAEPAATLPPHGPLTTQVLGYFVGNCVNCHNGSNGASSSFDLRPDAALENLIDQPTMSSATADGIRVVPGSPDESVLFAAVAGNTDIEVKDMPPVGVALRDESAIDLLREWIIALGTEESEP
jgi:hypothetical protein